MSIFSSSVPPPPGDASVGSSEFADTYPASPSPSPASSNDDELRKIKLPMADVGQVNRQSQIRGTTLGITCGLLFGEQLEAL
jgi:hypothetical protein